jgi:glycine cleavage system H protein
VIAINDEIVATPGIINADPHGKGWFYKLRVSQPLEIEKLLTPSAYEQSIGK